MFYKQKTTIAPIIAVIIIIVILVVSVSVIIYVNPSTTTTCTTANPMQGVPICSTTTTTGSTSQSTTTTTTSSNPLSDMPTFVSSSTSPDQGYYFTGMSIAIKYVSGAGHKVYNYLFINTGKTFTLPSYDTSKTISFQNQLGQTNNIYWQAFSTCRGGCSSNHIQDYGTVGGDIRIDSTDGTPVVDQYVDTTFTGQLGSCNFAYVQCSDPHNSPDSTCASPSGSQASSLYAVDSGGEEREAIYVIITSGPLSETQSSISYLITGGRILFLNTGETAFDILIQSGSSSPVSNQNFCWSTNSPMSFSVPKIDWAIRSPPSGMVVPGNFAEFPVSTSCCIMNNNGGTPALLLEEIFNVASPI